MDYRGRSHGGWTWRYFRGPDPMAAHRRPWHPGELHDGPGRFHAWKRSSQDVPGNGSFDIFRRNSYGRGAAMDAGDCTGIALGLACDCCGICSGVGGTALELTVPHGSTRCTPKATVETQKTHRFF